MIASTRLWFGVKNLFTNKEKQVFEIVSVTVGRDS